MNLRLATTITILLALAALIGGSFAYVKLENATWEEAVRWAVAAMTTLEAPVGVSLSEVGSDVTSVLILAGPGLAAFYGCALIYVLFRGLVGTRRRRGKKTIEPAIIPDTRLTEKAAEPIPLGGAKPQSHVTASTPDGGEMKEVAKESPFVATVTTTTNRHHDHPNESTGIGPVSPAPEEDSRKVVLVDDDPIILKLYSKLLSQAGVTPITASNGPDAYRLIAEEPPEIAIIDFMMPLLSGIQICEKLRHEEALRDMKIILFTSDEQSHTRDEAIRAGADAVVTKIGEPSVLIGTVLGMLS